MYKETWLGEAGGSGRPDANAPALASLPRSDPAAASGTFHRLSTSAVSAAGTPGVAAGTKLTRRARVESDGAGEVSDGGAATDGAGTSGDAAAEASDSEAAGGADTARAAAAAGGESSDGGDDGQRAAVASGGESSDGGEAQRAVYFTEEVEEVWRARRTKDEADGCTWWLPGGATHVPCLPAPSACVHGLSACARGMRSCCCHLWCSARWRLPWCCKGSDLLHLAPAWSSLARTSCRRHLHYRTARRD
jgi:hypothetical protein